MGSSSSKPVVEASEKNNGTMKSAVRFTSNNDDSKQPTPLPTPPTSPQVNVGGLAKVDASSSSSSSKESKCPMHRADGTYSFDWRALFQPAFPHGPTGSKPLTEDEARANITRRLSCMDATMASPGTGCPIKEHKETIQKSTRAVSSASVFGGGGGGCPVKQGGQQQQQEYNVYAQPIDPKNNMPQEANQLPAPGQTKPLSTDRVKSSIPKGGASSQETTTTWTYPSPQMFYNALARKGKLDDDTDETDIASVVALHNNMNEKTWQKVLEWEAVLNPTPNSDNDNSSINTPKLLKFTGRPTDLSPKAWFKHYILGHPLPFDRHDWTVLRSDPAHTGGATIRYVIDYYYDESRARQDAASSMPDLNDAHATPSLLIDVRPALDGPTQLWNRIVTMPLARRNFLGNNKTKFEPLPMFPTRDMKSQVSESVSVWQSIQLAAAGSKTREETEGEAGQLDQHSAFKNIPPLNDKDAIELAKNLSRALQECRQAQAAIDNLSDDNDDDDSSSYAKASMDLTICLGKILCPLQHSALTQAARGDNEDKIEAALASLNDCVLLKTTQHEISRRQKRQQQQ